MLILDTNVVSELMRPAPDARVVSWVDSQPASSQFITTITEAELRFGVAVLAAGQRKKRLGELLEEMFRQEFAERILPFDRGAAAAYAPIVAGRRKAGQPIAQFDAQIAAVAASRGAAVVTRNEADFFDCGIEAINPWQA